MTQQPLLIKSQHRKKQLNYSGCETLISFHYFNQDTYVIPLKVDESTAKCCNIKKETKKIKKLMCGMAFSLAPQNCKNLFCTVCIDGNKTTFNIKT